MKPGIYTFSEVLTQAGVDPNSITDFRTVDIGGLRADSFDETFRVPDTADKLEVRINGKVTKTFKVK